MNIKKYLSRFFPKKSVSCDSPELRHDFKTQPFRFNQETELWMPSNFAGQETDKDGLIVATLNTWFGEYFFERRIEAALKILKDSGADIIGLQEMTRESLEILSCEPWIRNEFAISDIDGSTFNDYGTVILSRVPIKRLDVYRLPGPMERQVVVAEYVLNRESLHVVVVHLESWRSSAQVRIGQLQTLFEFLKDTKHSLIMGDFNFCASWEENLFLDPAYTDVWSHLRPGDPGYTEDTEINRMRAFVTRKSKQVRFDRILLRSKTPGWAAHEIERFGMSPVSPDLPFVYPSDHFGLIGRLRWRTEDTPC